MSKFSKKSLAVLTTAAIMASTATIVAFADHTLPADLKVTVTDYRGTASDFTATSRTFKDDVLSWTAPEGKIVKVNGVVNKEGTYTIAENDEVIVITLEDAPAGGTSEPTPAGEENFDKVVWVNGKDTKANAKTGTPASLYKSENYDQVMMSAGGKWQVAVTPATVATVDDFMKEFDEKGKLTNAKDYKELASAKIKEGTVTVTAGKKGGEINVWVYEVKAKAVVNTEQVKPEATKFTVKVAPTMVVTAAAVKVTDGAVPAIDKAEKLEKSYAPSDEVYAYFGDKKAATSLDATFVIMNGKEPAELTDGKFVGDGFTAELVAAGENGPAVKIVIAADAKEKTKVAVAVKNVESGKIAKISTTVGKAAETPTPGGEEGGETPNPAPEA